MNSEDNLLIIAQEIADQMPRQAKDLERAARELKDAYLEIGELRELASFWRDKVETQTRLRVDAQARAGRIARAARR
jgi:hypothetical protein